MTRVDSLPVRDLSGEQIEALVRGSYHEWRPQNNELQRMKPAQATERRR